MWVTPTAVPYVTSPFNLARRHPVTGVVQPHTGTDFRAPTGTPLRAATSGMVVKSTYDAATAGNYVRIDVGGGVWIGYSHLSRRDVTVGQSVAAGQTIGLAGDTGSATAAHLHFEVCVAGTKIDPVPYLDARTGGLVSNPITGGGGSLPTVPTSPPIAPIETRPDVDLNNPNDVQQLKGVIAQTLRENLGDGGNVGGLPAGWMLTPWKAVLAQLLRDNVGDLAAMEPGSWWSSGMKIIIDRAGLKAPASAASIADALKGPLAEALAPHLAAMSDADVTRIADAVADSLSTRLAQ